MKIPYKILLQFLEAIKKDHGGKFGIRPDDYDEIELDYDNEAQLIVCKGVYDCPPRYFKYGYGMSTDWKVKNLGE